MTNEAGSPFEHFIKHGNSQKIIPSLDSKNLETRIAAIDALGRIADDHAMNALIGMIGHPDQPTRLAAVKALGITGKQTGKSHLQHLLIVEKNEEVIKAIRAAIASIPLVR
jgi:HEAT repeat protein